MSSSSAVLRRAFFFGAVALVVSPFIGPMLDFTDARDLRILWMLRLPRALLGFLAGAGFRFPLNDRLGMVLEYEKYFDVGTMATGESDISAISAGLLWSLGGRKE